MRNYCIFLKKELIESAKTFKLLVMGLVFLTFGMLSPLTAKYTPQVMQWILETDATIDEATRALFEAIFIDPVALDSWTEFFSNIGLMGLIVTVIVFSSMLASELKSSSTGTLTIILTKGISRASVLLAKVSSAMLIWTGSLAVAALTCYGYTAYMFDDSVSNLLFGIFCLWVFGLFLLAVTALFAAITKKGYICMMLVGTVAVVLNVVNVVPRIAKYNPVSLLEWGFGAIAETAELSDAYPSLIVAGVCTVGLVGAAVMLFDKRKL